MNTQESVSASASQNQFGWIIGAGVGAVAFGGIALALAPIAVPAIGIGATAIGLGALSSTAIGAGLVATSATIGAIAGVFAEPVIKNFFEDYFRSDSDKIKSNSSFASTPPTAQASSPVQAPAPPPVKAPPPAPLSAQAMPPAEAQAPPPVLAKARTPAKPPVCKVSNDEFKINQLKDRFSTLSEILYLNKEDSLKLQNIGNLFCSSEQDNIPGDEDLKLQRRTRENVSSKIFSSPEVEIKHLSYFKLLCQGILESSFEKEKKILALKMIIKVKEVVEKYPKLAEAQKEILEKNQSDTDIRKLGEKIAKRIKNENFGENFEIKKFIFHDNSFTRIILKDLLSTNDFQSINLIFVDTYPPTAPSPSPQTFLAVREVLNIYRSKRFEAIERFLGQSELNMNIASFNRVTEKTRGIFEMSDTKEFNLVNQYEKKLRNLGIYSALPPSSMKLQLSEQVEAKQLYYFHHLCLGVLESEASPENKKIALKAIFLEEKHTRKPDEFGNLHKNFVANFFAQNADKNNTEFASLIKEKGKVLAGEINAYQASENEKIFANGIFKYSMYSDPEIIEYAREIHSQSPRSR